jgi:hypothetical protein
MQRGLPAVPLVGATPRLALERDHLGRQHCRSGAHLLRKAGFELLGFQPREHLPKRSM